MATETAQARDEAQIRQIIADQIDAICAKDVDRIMSRHADAVIYFDCKPPFQTKGRDAFRHIREERLPCFPASFAMEKRDLKIFVSGDLALAHCLFRFIGEDREHPAMQTWMRLTTGCQKREGRWRIVHEHCSLPFDPSTSQAVFTLEP